MKLKSEKGITLNSLVIYVLAMTIIVSVMSTITIYFKQNTEEIQALSDNTRDLTRFNQYISSDIENSTTATIEDAGKKLILTTKEGNNLIYTITKNPNNNMYGIYRKKVKICDNVKQETKFEKEQIYNKEKIIVTLKIGEIEVIEKTIEYTILN